MKEDKDIPQYNPVAVGVRGLTEDAVAGASSRNSDENKDCRSWIQR
jgi:hypothetical protein